MNRIIQPHFGIEYPYFDFGILTNVLFDGYNITSIVGFIFAWISTVLLLRQYSVSWKGKAHWIIISLPLIYFLVQYQPLFLNIFSNIVKLEPVSLGILRILIITYSKPIGGLIFGAAFWTIAVRLRRENITMDYVTSSAYGFALLFVSNQSIVLSTAPYPPFGLATTNFLALSCYMVFLGIFSSAVSISQNTKLRQEIKKLVENKSNMLDSIARSEWTHFIEKEVIQIHTRLSDKIETETGMQPALSADDAKDYCNQVIEEIDKSRSPGTDS